MNFFNRPANYNFKDDFLAGVTVGIVTIPQAMAFALLAGLPPIYGLYGSLIPLVVYGLLSSSNFLNIGPVSVISIFIFESISPFVHPFTSEYINAVIILGLMIGAIQILLGVFKLGRFIEYLPKSVISGFIQAAAVVIIISQLSPGLGLAFPLKANYIEKLHHLFLNFELIHLASSTLFFLSLVVLFVFSTLFPKFPTAIILLILTGGLSFFFDFEGMNIALIGEVPQGLPRFIMPDLKVESLRYLPSAFGITFVATVGSYVMAKNAEDQQTQPINLNQDLMALGMAKVVSAFFGALVPAGSFNRSILNIKAGAKTQMSSLISAVVILFTLLFLTEIVYFLPQAVIAAIIVYSVYFLFDFPLIKRLLRQDKVQAFYLLLTAITTLGYGFVYGIAVGLFISFLGSHVVKKRTH
ncbi:MAG: SulP family inorganic anion transporter [Flavobacteriaceae bacterium]